MSRSWRNSLALLGFGFCLIPALLLVLDRIDPPDITRKAATSPILLARHGEVLNILPAGDGQFRLAADPAKIDPFYLTVLLAAEDKRFFQHPGVDPLAMLRAAGQWLTAGHVRSGGSTITMQVARLIEPRRRTVFAKMRQVFRAVQLESRYSKQQILGLYLTLAPFGGNLEGVRMASLAYFGQEPEHLSPDQAILLAILPRSPEANRPDRHPEQTKSAMLRLVARLAAKGVLPATMADQIAATPIKGERIAYGAAPHLARRFARAGGGQSNTHIDKSLQLELEALARAESERQHGVGIAMLVTDLPERRIRAWIGSPGFSAPQGQVDMVTRLRSPGSALKPFIYAIAIDKGLIHPGTRLEDRQTRFGDYVPRNFDRAYTGTVTVTEALQQSLNLPAVILLDRLGPRWFHQTMQTLGLPLAQSGHRARWSRCRSARTGHGLRRLGHRWRGQEIVADPRRGGARLWPARQSSRRGGDLGHPVWHAKATFLPRGGRRKSAAGL
jgi:penicillin-binding protein 1C